ncbi:MAG: peptidyl-alpha-hydroxyglycine alpha-amidating lyase family protein [Gammaproteobacteria bacterium]|jgi:sugar lactone lactonase YvrE|nr:peptidyl-alpha-hydroxyglycine alpha-amidating lyase family protein [Gammaproteobacteria bacterium]
MKNILLLLLLCIASQSFSQPPDRPFRPLNAYTLEGYRPIDVSEAFDLPAGVEFTSVASVAINSAGHLIVLQRSPVPFLEFDAEGTFIRSFGTADLFNRSHGLRIDEQDNLWVTDVSDHIAMKLNPDGEILMSIGSRGESGTWDVTSGSLLLAEPNDIALDSYGNFYIAQGHGNGAVPEILKFNSSGEFIMKWGALGNDQGEFAVAHSIVIDSDNTIYVADRENTRIQTFDTNGNYIDQWNYNTLICALYLHDDGFMYITTGFDGELAKLEMDGSIIGSIGKSGSGNGEFGEGHSLVVDDEGNIFISDVINRRVQKFEKE